jgi:hypothetical protein
MRASFGSFSDARRNSLSVRLVPEAEVNLLILNDRIWTPPRLQVTC